MRLSSGNDARAHEGCGRVHQQHLEEFARRHLGVAGAPASVGAAADDDVQLGCPHNTAGLSLRGIGKNALIGTGARVMPGCVVEELGVLGAGSIIKKDSRVEANSICGGIPARFIRMRSDKDAHDDDVTKVDAGATT